MKFYKGLLCVVIVLSLSSCTDFGDSKGSDDDNSSGTGELLNADSQSGKLVADDFFISFDKSQPRIFNSSNGYTTTDVVVTVRANDFNDLVQTNSTFQIKFKTSWGSFDSDQCSIDSTGSCSVTWHSGDPSSVNRPICEVAFTAYTSGEEFFLDSNDDGLFNSTETFYDLEEPYLDVDHDQSFTLANGKELIDIAIYSNGVVNGLHDGGDGKYNGSLCDDISTNSFCSSTQSTIIWTKSFINVVDADDGSCIN